MSEQIRLIEQCQAQKKSIQGFIADLKKLRKGTDQLKEKIKYKMQIIKYRKRSSALSTRILNAEHILLKP